MPTLSQVGGAAQSLLAIQAALSVASGASPAFIGFVPIPNVTKIGVVSSHKAVKFRARGPAFFAYQTGEYEGVAINVRVELFGPSKWLIYWSLYALFQWGRPRAQNRYSTRSPYGSMSLSLHRVPGDFFFQSAPGWGVAGPSGALGNPVMIPGSAVTTPGGMTNLQLIDQAQTGGASTIPYEQAGQQGIIDISRVVYHHTLPFVSKEHVALNAYIESIILDREASTSDKIVVDLMIREFKKDLYEEGGRVKIAGSRGLIDLASDWKQRMALLGIMGMGSTLFEYTRSATMRRVDMVDLMMQDSLNTLRMYRFWGSTSLTRDVVDLDPKIDIYDPLQDDGTAAVDVTSWYYFDLSDDPLPKDVSIDTREFGGNHVYSMMFYMVDEVPRNQYGAPEKVLHLMCTVKDENENITDSFKVEKGIIYHIGDKNLKICFDQVSLRYMLALYEKFGHTITGRWDYEQ